MEARLLQQIAEAGPGVGDDMPPLAAAGRLGDVERIPAYKHVMGDAGDSALAALGTPPGDV